LQHKVQARTLCSAPPFLSPQGYFVVAMGYFGKKWPLQGAWIALFSERACCAAKVK
jgi:hypothetical protein